MSLPKLFLLFISFIASVSALATPHAARSLHHRNLAGRIPVPAAVGAPSSPVRSRQNSKRCKPRSSSTPQQDNVPTTSRAPKPPATQAATTPKVATTTKATTTARAATTTPHELVATHTPVTTKRPTTTQHQAPPAPTIPSSSKTGQGTFYSTGLGACGITNKDTDFIAAVSHELFDTFPGYGGQNPNNNPICGRKVTATFQNKSVTVKITDRCEGCSFNDLDFSPSAFSQLADFALGRLSGVVWKFDD